MPEQALYLKWRPLYFNDVVGQEHITRTLRNSLKTGRIRHAYLFSGPRGTGKTTTARLLAKAVNCTNEDADIRPCNTCDACIAVNEGRYLDLIEIDAATHTGVDDVRDLRDKIAFNPGQGRYKVYIIDEVHRFTGNAFDALLKTLEEPPEHAIFVLATTEIDKVPSTIKSRCLQFEFRRVSLMQVSDRLQMIAESEGIKIEREALELIAREGTGSVRDSISLLDQIVSDPEEHISLEVAQRILGTANTSAVKTMVDALVEKNIPHGLHIINEAVDSGSDPRQFGQQVVEHLRAVLLTQTASADLVEASSEDRELFARQSRIIERHAVLKAIRAFNEAVNDYKGGWQPQLSLELAFIDSVRNAEAEVVQQVVQVVQQGVGLQQAASAPMDDLPEAEEMEPGEPPVIDPAIVQQRWGDMLKALYSINQSAPEVVQNYRVHHVDGNLVYLCTDDNFLFGRLNGQPAKLGIIERALYRVHNVRLRVQVMLVNNMPEGFQTVTQSDDGADDLLLREVQELGGQVREGVKPPPKPTDDEAEPG